MPTFCNKYWCEIAVWNNSNKEGDFFIILNAKTLPIFAFNGFNSIIDQIYISSKIYSYFLRRQVCTFLKITSLIIHSLFMFKDKAATSVQRMIKDYLNKQIKVETQSANRHKYKKKTLKGPFTVKFKLIRTWTSYRDKYVTCWA